MEVLPWKQDSPALRLIRLWSMPAAWPLRGIQFDYITPYSMGGNFTLQYQLTPSMSFQAGYVTSLARHLEVFPNSNNVTAAIAGPTRTSPTGPAAKGGLPFPGFRARCQLCDYVRQQLLPRLQSKVEKQFADGLNFLATYTCSKMLYGRGRLAERRKH